MGGGGMKQKLRSDFIKRSLHSVDFYREEIPNAILKKACLERWAII